jgi:hypothetical protein
MKKMNRCLNGKDDNAGSSAVQHLGNGKKQKQ